MQKAYLILENGTIFEGKSFGAAGEAVGEIVFTTAMTGYLETLTDPSYYGQIVVQTFPLIGNYGVIPADFESGRSHVKAYIVRDWCQEPSNFRCEGDLDTFLKQNNIVGLYGIDTRQLTKIVRESGVMNGKIVAEGSGFSFDDLKSYRITDAVKNTTCEREQVFAPEGEIKRRVCLFDFGAKDNIRRELVKRGCEVTVVPAYTTCERVEELNPDGIMLSNGPGDPAENVGIIGELKKLAEKKIPTFGICLGHQLLALSQGGRTEKLKYGHRGANQPAAELETGRVYITSQNHGYAVINDSMGDNAKVSFVNANDGTCEGITYLNMPAFSVQFHPEACGGPLDTGFLFDKFMALIDENK
ncbi:carbamoyl phosphate synthase small subunit [Ruminococcus sp. Marseille-P6503]|uniref:carbamoyl phosphate synthase small subunit n=1 Tax=Ruminococcus sp. Marseille-P6503 TaxID=2364796 RepID=UPI000F53CA41|nr:carbamoyl phosphate synthase small subunit [Ruminococcus sp. Marseille-P6503]